MKIIYSLLLLIPLFLFACAEKKKTESEEEVMQIGLTPCRTTAPFIKDRGFDPTRSSLSTDEAGITGIALVEYPRKVADSASKRIYQDVSWVKNGPMGNTTTDISGNIYTAPLPGRNGSGLPLKNMNKVFKIDSETGEMIVLTDLPESDSSKDIVPFAVLGIYYDCHGKKLYVSSIAGSTKDKERGVIYVIDPETGKIEDKLKDHDAASVFVGGITGEKRLYFGGLRTSDIYSVKLTDGGNFVDDVRSEIKLLDPENLNGDRAKNIRFDEKGNMLVFASKFNFTVADVISKTETTYQFSYDKNKKIWSRVDGG